tara:strand:+ start:1015 stop:1416 length:402 start_codon:yes stop_codon:yes gene_type:complete
MRTLEVCVQIELNNDEIAAILDAICNQLTDLEDVARWLGGDVELPAIEERITFLSDLDMDIREQQARFDDEWSQRIRREKNGNDLAGLTFLVGEDDFVDAGIQAREQQKLNNRLMQGTQNSVDIWSLDGLEDE